MKATITVFTTLALNANIANAACIEDSNTSLQTLLNEPEEWLMQASQNDRDAYAAAMADMAEEFGIEDFDSFYAA